MTSTSKPDERPALGSREMSDDVPPLVARLDATRAAVGRGRIFADSAAIIRAGRERDLPPS